jgi:hypothetical protein
MQSSITAGSALAGTAMTASQTSSGIACTVGQLVRPPTFGRFGLTGYTDPVAPADTCRHSVAPIVSGRSDAPTTAIVRGIRIRATARESARCSRRSTESRNSSVSASSKSRSMTPLSNRRWTGQPARLNTASIGWFSASTSAVKRRIPLDRAIAARCSSSSVAMPLPWWRSSTMNAASASSRPVHRS